MFRIVRPVAAIAIALVGLAACDDSGGFDKEAFCKIARELNEGESAPTPEQLDEYVENAPDDIKEDAEFVAGKFKEAGDNIGAVFSDPEVGEKIEGFEAAESRECGLHQDDQESEGEEEEEGDPEPAAGASVVEVTAVEYAFEGVPETIPAGLTALQLTNGGEEVHEMFVGKLAEGKTLDDALAVEGDPIEAGVVTEEVGEAFATPGGDPSYVNAELTPGTYGMVCFIPGPGGKPHAELGMKVQFTVA